MQYLFYIIAIMTIISCGDNTSFNKNAGHQATSIDGEKIYKENCASCHRPDRDATGPALRYGLEHLGSKERLVAFVQNSEAFSKDDYIIALKKKFPSSYTHQFENLSATEIFTLIYWCNFYNAR